jgi:hypothetical protein
MRLNRTHKIIVAAAAVVLVIILIASMASCSPKKADGGGTWDSGRSATGCVPPLACGPHYAGYVPPFFLSHPSYTLLSPYRSLYAPSYNGRSYTTVQTPAGRAPVTTRKPMPYPPGYKPVPGDFQPPTAKAPAPAPAKPAVKPPAPAKKQADAPKRTTPKQINKVPARSRSGR